MPRMVRACLIAPPAEESLVVLDRRRSERVDVCVEVDPVQPRDAISEVARYSTLGGGARGNGTESVHDFARHLVRPSIPSECPAQGGCSVTRLICPTERPLDAVLIDLSIEQA